MKHKENYNFKQTSKFIANVISWTILAILVLIAVFLLYYYVANKIADKRGEKFTPAIGLYTIVSPSMTPNLNVYDVILDVKVKKPTDIKVGDIITFISTSAISKGYTVTHRVIALVETENGIEYKTQGDNNMSPDATTVAFKNVLGKVVLKIPQLGRIQYFLSSSYGWLIIVVIPAIIIIMSDIYKIIKLSDAQKKVTYALKTEEVKVEKEQEKKEEIKKILKKRYSNNRSDKEPDPLPTNRKLTKVSSKKSEENNKTKAMEKPKETKKVIPPKNIKIDSVKFELPKLKDEDEKSDKKK